MTAADPAAAPPADPAMPRLYELVLANGRSASPYVWRIRYALAHKDQRFESVALGFTEIPAAFGGRFKTVPVLESGGAMLAESWDIAEHLERTIARKPLFSGPAENATVRLVDAWVMREISRRLIGIYVLDVHDAARAEDRAYFRQSREARFGKSLEEVAAGREARLPELREAFEPLRMRLAQRPFLGGDAPNYADYILLSVFQWLGSIATLPPLAGNDHVLRAWLDRGFGLYEGFGGDPRMRPLFD